MVKHAHGSGPPNRTICALPHWETAQEWPGRMWQRAQGLDLATILPSSSIGCLSTSLVHGVPTWQPTELNRSSTNALVPETTGRPQRSYVYALMGQSPVRSTIGPAWIRLDQSDWDLGVWSPAWHLELFVMYFGPFHNSFSNVAGRGHCTTAIAIRERWCHESRVLGLQWCLGGWCMLLGFALHKARLRSV